MSFSIGSLVGFVKIDHSGVRTGMSGAEKEVKAGQARIAAQADRGGRDIGARFGKGIHANVKSSLDDIGKSWKEFGTGLLAGFAVEKVVDFFKSATDAASDFEQSVGGVDAVFGKYAAGVHQKSQQAAQDLGLSANAYNELITVSGAMLKNKGLTDFAAQSEKLVGIGADLAAQYGGPTSQAVEALNAAMRGESDPIERYGISLNETAVNAKLAQMGLSGLTGTALETAKTQARLQIITDQSKDALGAFARESDTAAGKQQRLAAEWENQKRVIGEQLLPMMVGLTDFVSGKALPAFSGMIDMLVKLGGVIGNIPGPVKAALTILIAFHLLKGPIASMLETVALKALYAGDRLKGLGVGAGMAKAGLGGMSKMLGGAWGVGIMAATGLLMAYAQAQQDAKQDTDDLTASIDEQTGRWTDKSREVVADKIKFDVNPDDLQLLKQAGIDLGKLSDEVLNGGPAFDARIRQLQAMADKSGPVGEAAKGLMLTMLRERDAAIDSYKAYQVKGDLLPGLADKENDVANAAGNAADATSGAADATSGAGGAAADATPKTKTYADRLADLKTAADEAAQKNQDLATAILAVTDAAVGSDEANIKYNKTLDDAQDRVKKRAEIEKQLKELGGPSARTKELRGKGVSGVSDHTRDLQTSLANESDPKKRARLQEQLSKSQTADARRSAKERASISSQLSKSEAADAKRIASERRRLLEQLAELSKGLDVNTEAGRQNKQMLIDLAGDARDAAEKSLKNKESLKSVADTMATRRKDFIEMAKAFGANADEAEALADKYSLTKGYVDDVAKSLGDVPKDQVAKLTVETTEANAAVDEAKTHLDGYWEVVNGVPTFRETTVTTPGLPEAKSGMDDYVEVVNGVPTSRKTQIEVERDEALRKLAEVRAILAGIRDKTVSITAIYEIAGPTAALAAQNQRRLDDKGLDRRFGGAVPGYAGGTLVGPGTGTSDSIAAVIRETGRALNVSAGEFISTDSSRRRNLAALEAGNRGHQLGVVQPGGTGPAFDYVLLAQAVGRELAEKLPQVRMVVGVADVQAASMER